MTECKKNRIYRRCAKGIALPTVLVMLLLSSLLALSGWRDIWLNEKRLQARADVLRTQWLADASLHAALDDVLQRGPLTGDPTNNDLSQRYDMGSAEQQHVFIPRDAEQLGVLRLRLGTRVCQDGICAPDKPLAPPYEPAKPLPSVIGFWQSWASSAMTVVAQNKPQPSGDARYWIEIFSITDVPEAPTLVYRITAMATGLKSAKPVVVQAIWGPVQNTQEQTNQTAQGRWLSGTVLHD